MNTLFFNTQNISLMFSTIKNKTKICMIGCGYIGESLINVLKDNYDIIGYDISKKRINELKQKYSSCNNIEFIDTEQVGKLEFCTVYIIAIPTNINNEKEIKLDCFYQVKEILKMYLKPGDMIIVESSIYVGGTRKIFADLQDEIKYSPLYLCFSSERVSPGDEKKYPIKYIPKVISGINNDSLNKITELYSKCFETVVTAQSIEEAELSKLYENNFRVVNIAFVNQMAEFCKIHNINFYNVIELSKTKPFGFMPFYPGFGVGSICLPQNPYFLFNSFDMTETNTKALPLLQDSIKFLEDKPIYIFNQIKHKQSFLFVGLTDKKDVNVLHFSPVLKILNLLTKEPNKQIYIYENINRFDPIQSTHYLNQYLHLFESNLQNLLKIIESIDYIIIGSKHSYIDSTLLNIILNTFYNKCLFY